MRLQSWAPNRKKAECSNFAGLRLEGVKIRVTVIREFPKRFLVSQPYSEEKSWRRRESKARLCLELLEPIMTSRNNFAAV